ncbi:putative RNA polymerase sigma factor [Alloactinosynnema sp. L-07]|uniref:SigE family RNA polymerase sigma factor n=1 Tax=Alloactinosynnema sp. L-07 TaxID=1653480 RepID=UPI00065EFC1F|nr:SigE family RNA polymerase sigma factor [Alloactinosynnema sp. L-07]CRK57618.1 putative RNA polymerase sigma factor [Alloactinosynnema sp. L-07]
MRKVDEDRFRGFVQDHAAAMRRSAYLLCGDWHLAEDLVQTALIKVHGAWPRVTRTDHPVGYARTTLLRCWLDERRRPWRRSERRVGQVPDGVNAVADPAVAHQRTDLRDELFVALSSIPPRQRAALVLRFFEALSVAETARALGCSEGTVKSQTARGLAAMKAALGDVKPQPADLNCGELP